MAFDQNIFATEFIVRITSFWRVAMRLYAEMKIENLSSVAESIVDFFLCPDVKSAFGSLGVAEIGRAHYSAIGVFGGKKSTFLRCHIASDIIEDVARH